MQWFSKVCSVDLNGSATSPKGTHGYISTMGTSKFTHFLYWRNVFFLNNHITFFNWRCVYFVWLLEYLIKKPPVPTKQGTFILIKVKSCNALLQMLLVGISVYLKWFLRYKFLILDIYHMDTIFMWVRMWGSDVCVTVHHIWKWREVPTWRNSYDLLP